MSFSIVFLALFASVCTAGAQLGFKTHMEENGKLGVAALLHSRPAVTGVVLYFVYFAALVWAYHLGGEVSVVFPLTAVAYPLTAALGWLLLKERFTWRVPVATCLIVVGCVLVSAQ